MERNGTDARKPSSEAAAQAERHLLCEEGSFVGLLPLQTWSHAKKKVLCLDALLQISESGRSLPGQSSSTSFTSECSLVMLWWTRDIEPCAPVFFFSSQMVFP
jgi:hypothetical protein